MTRITKASIAGKNLTEEALNKAVEPKIYKNREEPVINKKNLVIN